MRRCESAARRPGAGRIAAAILKDPAERSTPVRRITISFGGITDECNITTDMFTDEDARKREHSLLSAVVDIKDKFGKNSILRGMSFEEKATTRARNLMIGGHNADVPSEE